MDNTVVGNLCGDPTLRGTDTPGRPVARFTVAVNRWRRVGTEFVPRPPVFHRVVCFGYQAENASNTLRKGMEVLVVGEWVDDSYADDKGQKHTGIALEARVLGPGLRWATAAVTKVERGTQLLPLPEPTAPDALREAARPLVPDQPDPVRRPGADPPPEPESLAAVAARAPVELDLAPSKPSRRSGRSSARAG